MAIPLWIKITHTNKNKYIYKISFIILTENYVRNKSSSILQSLRIRFEKPNNRETLICKSFVDIKSTSEKVVRKYAGGCVFIKTDVWSNNCKINMTLLATSIILLNLVSFPRNCQCLHISFIVANVAQYRLFCSGMRRYLK